MPLRAILAVVLAAATPGRAALWAAEYFVAPTGHDANSGAFDAPFATLARGQQAAAPGDIVWIRGGVYEFSGTTADIGVLFNKSGAPAARIHYWAWPGETPIFDFFNLTPQARVRGFSVRADWLHFRGLELRGVQQILTNVNESWAIRVENGADHNIFERLNLHHNEGPGLFIADGGHNLVLNSDSHHNYDPDRGGENADGFGSHSNDPGNMFIGNRAWENSDDGFDLINSPGQVTIANSWAWRNGYIPGTNTAAGNGAGFKAGGFGLDSDDFPPPASVPRHVVYNNLAFDNRVQGFYANHHPGGIDFFNNTAFSNSRGFDLLADVEPASWPADHWLRNNVSYGNNADLVNVTPTDVDDEHNTWNPGYEANAADFLSLAPTGVDGPRQSDGSLPHLDFMRLAADSRLIDSGVDAGLPYFGDAPDLGAFEHRPPDADFDRDGDVDGADLLIWQRGFGLDAQTDYSAGDADANALVDDADFAVWQAQYGIPAMPVRAVPEPTIPMLWAGAVPVLLARRKTAGYFGVKICNI